MVKITLNVSIDVVKMHAKGLNLFNTAINYYLGLFVKSFASFRYENMWVAGTQSI